MDMKDITLKEHMRRAVKARWAKTTPEERSDYARMMVRAREEKRRIEPTRERIPAPSEEEKKERERESKREKQSLRDLGFPSARIPAPAKSE